MITVVIQHIHVFLQDKVREESTSISIAPPKSETRSQNFATQRFEVYVRSDRYFLMSF